MKQHHANGNRYAERAVVGRDDRGDSERVTIWIDRRNGETVTQLYVSDSYAGSQRDWNAARDSAL